MKKLTISNTEAQTMLLCEKQHEYRFLRNLEPKPHLLSTPLRRGLMGHVALENYYLALQAGDSVELARQAAMDSLKKQMSDFIIADDEDDTAIQIAGELKKILNIYFDYYETEPFKVLEVEKVYTIPINDSIDYGLKLDLLIEMIKGQFKGEIMVMDHKIIFNLKKPAEIEMNVQQPKYVHAVRMNDIPVRGAYLNQIRHRKMDRSDLSKIFQRTPIMPTSMRIKNIWEEQTKVAEKIQQRRENPNGYVALRNFSDLVCPYCPFQTICYNELENKNVDTMIEAAYRPSTYGYGPFVNLGTGE